MAALPLVQLSRSSAVPSGESPAMPAPPALVRKPTWLKVKAPGGETYLEIKKMMRDLGLHTVCEEARCPNIGDCWERRTATFLILGNVCTRHCAYCAIAHGLPTELDAQEPERVAAAVSALHQVAERHTEQKAALNL